MDTNLPNTCWPHSPQLCHTHGQSNGDGAAACSGTYVSARTIKTLYRSWFRFHPFQYHVFVYTLSVGSLHKKLFGPNKPRVFGIAMKWLVTQHRNVWSENGALIVSRY